MSSRFAAKRHNSCDNRRVYTNTGQKQNQFVLYQEIVDQTQSESSSSESEYSAFSSSKKSFLSLTAAAERSKSSTNSSIQLGKRQAMSKHNQQSSIHIHLKAKPRENSNSVKVNSLKKGKISTNMSIQNNPSPASSSKSSLKSSQNMEYSHLLAHKSPFQITIKGCKDGPQTLDSLISQTKPKNKFSESVYCDEIAYTNLKLRQSKEVQGEIADHISTTAKQGNENGKKPKKNVNSGVDSESLDSNLFNQQIFTRSQSLFAAPNNAFSTRDKFLDQENLLKNAELNNSNSTNPLLANANPKCLTRSESESCGQQYQKRAARQSSNLSITIGKKNADSGVTENDETKRNLKKKKNMFLIDDIEDSREDGDEENDEDAEDQNQKEANSAQTSVTQMKRTEDSLVQDWKESINSKDQVLFEQDIPKNNLNKPFFLFDENLNNKNIPKAIDDTAFNNWLTKGQEIRPSGEENIWNVWKNKRERVENNDEEQLDKLQNNKKLKKAVDQSTVNYEKMRYTTQGKDRMKFFEFNCFRDRDLGVPDQYMNKLQEITIDDDVMTDDETMNAYVEVCFTDLLEGIEMDQQHEEGVDHLWDFFYPPNLSQSQ